VAVARAQGRLAQLLLGCCMAGPREGSRPRKEENIFFFLFKKALNQILHHIYKPKFDLLT
jgi:hypothetical protein